MSTQPTDDDSHAALTCDECGKTYPPGVSGYKLPGRDKPDGRMELTCECGAVFVECPICGGFIQPGNDQPSVYYEYAGHNVDVHERCYQYYEDEDGDVNLTTTGEITDQYKTPTDI